MQKMHTFCSGRFNTSKYLVILVLFFILLISNSLFANSTRLLRQPTISDHHVAFIYGADLWIADIEGGLARRLTSTTAVESAPHFSPDGKQIAFTSNRCGVPSAYVIGTEGGTPERLTWYPEPATVCGWTPDGKQVLYATSRETAPTDYNRLWTVSVQGGTPKVLPAPMATKGSFSPDGQDLVFDRISRWDSEWRGYRGGQNTPLTILNLKSLEEIEIPSERTIDIHPVWLKDKIYFLSDRDGSVSNIWSFLPETSTLVQHTNYPATDIKWLTGNGDKLVYEYHGDLYLFEPETDESKQLQITVQGDFPWAETRWESVGGRIGSSSLSPTGKRALFEARGEIFTVPVEHGDIRNLTQSSDAADRAPIWSPKGEHIAWVSDESGKGYELLIGDQNGKSEPRRISLGISKMVWEPVWSPDDKYIAFVDDDTRIRVVDIKSGKIQNVDEAGMNIERGSMGLCWSFDSKWLAWASTAANRLNQIKVWSLDKKKVHILSDPLADAFAPSWDRNGKYLYFLASTDVALGAGWANTSAMQSRPKYGVYMYVLSEEEATPFSLRSDEEEVKSSEEKDEDKDKSEEKKDDKDKDKEDKDEETPEPIKIDFKNLEQRTIALPMPVRRYTSTLSGPEGSVFVGERGDNGPKLHKFTIEKRESKEFAKGARRVSVSADGKKMLFQSGGKWKVVDTGEPPGDGGETLKLKLRMQLDRQAEWKQIFEEAWRYERDYFYDPDMHGRDWNEVYERYAPLVPFIRHRSDLTYILDQVNGELSVGHSFVFGGDYPAVDTSRVGVLGADLEAKNGYWRIKRIYTTESWNPNLKAPLAQPGLKIKEGDYLVGVNGQKMTALDNPYRLLDATADRQTLLTMNTKPEFEDAEEVTVLPIKSESGLRQRAWVEDNRRTVDKLSDGKLAYIWVPNTSNRGVVSFNRYFFAQQNKQGAVIDERFNGGGLLDDYMVDLMTRKLRAAITNETPNGTPFRLPAGILGPKVLLINELAGSGGDFFPWVFRQQQAGPLIGKRTWGGLVKSSTHYRLVDGGALTAPDNAVFDPIKNEWIAENIGVHPDIEVKLDAASIAKGVDPQLKRAVQEALKLLKDNKIPKVTPPPFSTPAK